MKVPISWLPNASFSWWRFWFAITPAWWGFKDDLDFCLRRFRLGPFHFGYYRDQPSLEPVKPGPPVQGPPKVTTQLTPEVQELLDAARFAVTNSGDHGTTWCKSHAYGCKECEAYSKLKEALKPFGNS